MKVCIRTWGCAANQADSEALAGLLQQQGHSLVQEEQEADYIIANTCSVKNSTQSKELHYLRKIARNKKVIVGGCLTKTLDIRKHIPEITAVFDTNSLLKIPNILQNPHDEFSNEKESARLQIPVIRKDKDIAIIPISQGCISHCSFCSTKLARGNLKSYRIGDIKRAFEQAIIQGCYIIKLTSQDNGCYGFDIKTSLPELIDELTTIQGDYQIRVGMMNPWHLNKILPKLLKSYESKKIMKFLHIPVQSGAEKILKDMKRIHTVENFKSAVATFRQNFPGITIATDIIVGYPTESEQDFLATYNLIKETRPEVLNISMFSSRPNTQASKLKQLPSEIIKSRSKKLTELYNNYRRINKAL